MQASTRAKTRPEQRTRRAGLAQCALPAFVLATASGLSAQSPPTIQQPTPAPAAPSAGQAAPAQENSAVAARPLAIVPLDTKIPGAAAEVTGGMQVFNGRAFIAANGTITAGSQTTQVTLPYRGTLRVCASTTVKLAADASVPAGELPGLMIAMAASTSL